MKKTIKDVVVDSKRVLVRVDFNVPLGEGGDVADETRIVAALPTIQYLIDHNAKVVLCSHLGRPKGEVKPEFSLAPVAKRLARMINTDLSFVSECVGPEGEKAVNDLKDGEVILLENLRFHNEETKNDPEFAKKLAALCDIYVNDAFGTAHRAHASTEGITHYVDECVAGFLMEKEIAFLGDALENPARPFVTVLGGAKIADKIPVIENLFNKVDCLIIGGGMANTFLAAQGFKLGKSLVDKDSIELANQLMDKARLTGVKMMFPSDCVAAKEISMDAKTKLLPIEDIPEDMMSLDIGVATQMVFANELMGAKTIIWNGPMGVAEYPQFAGGTKAIAEAMSQAQAMTIVGGGDTASAVKKLGFGDKMTHISTGGGASLEFLEGKKLPGVEALNDK